VRTAKIISGASFDWEDAQKYSGAAVDAEGNVNWMAASFADPGVTSCPKCKAYYWNEGDIVECLDCGTQWETSNGKFIREHRGEKP